MSTERPSLPRANLDEAIEFLTAFHPGRPLHLVSLLQDRRATGRTFNPDELDAMRSWLAERQGIENTYFTVAEPHEHVRDRKVKKSDLAQTRYIPPTWTTPRARSSWPLIRSSQP